MIPVASATVNGRSQSLNASQVINMYAEIPEPDSKSPLVLRSSPGLSTFSTLGTGPIRGMHNMDGVAYVVTGNDLYSFDSEGTGTLIGSSGTITGTGAVFMESNFAGELMILAESGTAWLYDGATLATVASHDADFANDATSLAFIDQYFVFSKAGQVHAFDLNNGKSYNPLSFATAEYADDDVVQVYAHTGHLYVFGQGTTEIWYNAGTTPFPFARIGGAVYSDVGGVKNTVADVDQAVYWLGQDGVVYRAVALQIERISTPAIENNLGTVTNPRAFAYKQEGHAFYVLSTDQGCYVFDATTGLWHERKTYNLSRWRGVEHLNIYGKHLVGDYTIGRIYNMSLENYADGSAVLQRQVITPPLHADGLRAYMSKAQIHFEMGQGLTTGQGSDPQVILDWSDDGGKTYGNQRWASVGKIGEYTKRAIWRRLGSFRERNYRITYSDPTPFTIYGARI